MKSAQSVLFIVFHTKRIVAYGGMRVNENIAFIVFILFSDCKLLVKSRGYHSPLHMDNSIRSLDSADRRNGRIRAR